MKPQDEQLRQAMRGYAAGLLESQPLPPASVVWLRAERRRRRLAIERAERPLRIMQVVGLVCAVFAVAWMLYRSASIHAFPAVGTTWMVSSLAFMLLILAGCWVMVMASRRPLS